MVTQTFYPGDLTVRLLCAPRTCQLIAQLVPFARFQNKTKKGEKRVRDLTMNEVTAVSGAAGEGLVILGAITLVTLTAAMLWSNSGPCKSVWQEGYYYDVKVGSGYDNYGQPVDIMNTYYHPGEYVTVCR